MLKKDIRAIAIVFMGVALIFTLFSFRMLFDAVMYHGSAAPALVYAWIGLINAVKMIMIFQWEHDTEEIEEN